MSAIELIDDLVIETMYRDYCDRMGVTADQSNTLNFRLSFYMGCIQNIHDDPFDDPREHQRILARFDYHRTYTMAKIIYAMFFPKR